MATKAKKGYQQFKNDLAEGSVGSLYIFYGEEVYLREYYLGELRKQMVPAGFEEFNYHRLEGKGLTVQALTEVVEALPMMAERTLVIVTDYDIYKQGEEQRERLIALLESQNKQDLQDAVSQAAAGNLEPIKKMLAVLQESREGKDLVDQLGRK